MTELTEALCDLWEEEQVETNPHSRLYHLLPIGMGTPMVESLASYIMRLSEAHSVYPYILLSKEILPILELEETGSKELWLKGLWFSSPKVNGLTETTKYLVQSLEKLTFCRNLHNLTMLSWEYIFSSKELMRRNKAWCPLCYKEWINSGNIMYEPLLWALDVITMCPKHSVSLEDRCPYQDCARTLPVLATRSQIGFCPWCHRWLGAVSLKKGGICSVKPQQQYIYTMVSELLSITSSMSVPIGQEKFIYSIKLCLELIANGNVLALAEHFRFTRACVKAWCLGEKKIRLNNILSICHQLELSPIQFLTGNIEMHLSAIKLTRIFISSLPRQKKPHVKRDLEEIRRDLEIIVQSFEEPPPSVQEISLRLKYDRRSLYKHFSQHCQVISQKRLEYKSKQKEERRQKICKDVRNIAYELHAQGEYPGERKIKKMLATKGEFKQGYVRDAWKSALKELGLK